MTKPRTPADPHRVLVHDVRTAAIHEGGHYVVAKALGYPGRIEIHNLIAEAVDTMRYRSVSGQTHALPLDAPTFHLSIHAWAGIAAEEFADDATLDAGGLSLETQTHLELYQTSITDLEGIISHPQIWKTCRKACSLVIENWPEIARIAELAHEVIVISGAPIFIYPTPHALAK